MQLALNLSSYCLSNLQEQDRNYWRSSCRPYWTICWLWRNHNEKRPTNSWVLQSRQRLNNLKFS